MSSTCCGEDPARALSRRACECAVAHGRSRHERRALSRVIHRVLGLHRVVRLHLVHCLHLSAHVTKGGGVWNAQRVCDACAARAAEVASVFEARVRARSACSGPADSQPMASDMSTPSLLLTYERVLQCESTCVAGEARTSAAACRACSALVWSCARRRAASAGEAREAEARASACATVHFDRK